MYNKRNDEWGIIIQKQLEIDEVRNAQEKARYKQQQEEYKRQLDELLVIKNQQKRQQYQQKSQDIKEISNQLQSQLKVEDFKKHQKFEFNKKIVEENLRLQNMSNLNKVHEKDSVMAIDIHNNALDKSKYLENLNRLNQHRRSAEVEMNLNIKLMQDKNYMKKRADIEEKQKESYLVKLEELRFQQRDEEYKAHLNKIQEVQNKKMEVFSKNIAPQLMVKEVNYNQWVTHAEEVKRREEEMRLREIERKKGENFKVVKETLRWQSENKYMKKCLDKESERVIDDELTKRVEASLRIDEERNFKKKIEVLSYRDELLHQAAADKARRQGEFKLSEREKNLNRSLLDQDKSKIIRGANEILKSVDLSQRRTPLISPSLKNTTLQLS